MAVIHNPTGGLTALLHSLVKSDPKGADAIFTLLGDRDYTVMMNRLKKNGQHKLDADDVVPLALLTRPEVVGKHIASRLGGVFVPLPDVEVQGKSELMRAVAHSVREFSEFISASADGFADGVVEGHEYDEIADRSHEAISAIMGLVKLAKRTNREQFGSKKQE